MQEGTNAGDRIEWMVEVYIEFIHMVRLSISEAMMFHQVSMMLSIKENLNMVFM